MSTWNNNRYQVLNEIEAPGGWRTGWVMIHHRGTEDTEFFIKDLCDLRASVVSYKVSGLKDLRVGKIRVSAQ